MNFLIGYLFSYNTNNTNAVFNVKRIPEGLEPTILIWSNLVVCVLAGDDEAELFERLLLADAARHLQRLGRRNLALELVVRDHRQDVAARLKSRRKITFILINFLA
jgi:hypothetical protein